MPNYVALVDGAPGAYGVVIPDCPGCTAMGVTLDGALASAAEALRDWMTFRVSNGHPPPRARSAEEIRFAPDVIPDLSDRVAIALVPLLLDSGRTVRTALSFDSGLLDAIDHAARARGQTRSAFLASAAREKITEGR